jgi:hypothetical protein
LRVADPRPSKGELSLGFINDVALIAKGKSYDEAHSKLVNMMEKRGGTLQWSAEHHTEFELDKTTLVCLSRKQIPCETLPNKSILASKPAVTIHNHKIQPSSSHKFLGVITDENLNFKEHTAHALAKGTKYTMACSRMIRPTKGIKSRLMKRLYEGVVIPKMLYVADIWCAGLVSRGASKKLNSRGVRGFTSQMARVQRMATLLITGGMRSSATDILDAHANILPFQQALHKICFKSMLRMTTLLDSHPLSHDIKATYEYRAACNFCKPKCHPSPLHKLLYKFKLNPTKMEKILLIHHYPKWEADINIQIARKKEEAAEEDDVTIKFSLG